jgi:hypothetical protein
MAPVYKRSLKKLRKDRSGQHNLTYNLLRKFKLAGEGTGARKIFRQQSQISPTGAVFIVRLTVRVQRKSLARLSRQPDSLLVKANDQQRSRDVGTSRRIARESRGGTSCIQCTAQDRKRLVMIL